MAAAAILLWATLGLTINFVLGSRQPAVSLSVWPFGSESRAASAGQSLAARPDVRKLHQIRRLTSDALRKDPLNVHAARNLGIAEAELGNRSAANAAFEYAERLSRRDLPTQIWLIERAVDRDDVAEILAHYDRALRTSVAAEPLLFPVLVEAITDPKISRELGILFRNRPPWMGAFFKRALHSENDAVDILPIARGVGFDSNLTDDRRIISMVLARLVRDARYREAYHWYLELTDSRADRNFLQAVQLEDAGRFPPFDWTLRNEPTLYAHIEENSSEQIYLKMQAEAGAVGWLARRLLVLPVGNYRLSGVSADIRNTLSSPHVVLRCIQRVEPILNVPISPSARNIGTFTFDISISDKCPAQWLELTPSPNADGGTDAWISAFNIQRIS